MGSLPFVTAFELVETLPASASARAFASLERRALAKASARTLSCERFISDETPPFQLDLSLSDKELERERSPSTLVCGAR
jgi:hypothetical protein